MPNHETCLKTFRDELPIPLPSGTKRNAAFEFSSAAAYFDQKADSERTATHFDCVCEIAAGPLYKRAFERWKQLWEQAEAAGDARTMPLPVTQRLLIGLSNSALWETSITMNPTYGVPILPGSALKGLARHFAESHLCPPDADDLSWPAVYKALFGHAGDSGAVEFHDAWWVSESAPQAYGKDRPFVREVVTPHHKAFLDKRGGVPATPFDNPTPIPQLATHGEFLVVAAGSPVWAAHALDILRLALEVEGIGARTPEYGRMGPAA